MIESRESLRERVIRALALEHPYRCRPPMEGRPAAVLLLLAASETRDEPHVLMTQRTESVATHKGQYAFPGGMRDDEDASLAFTALRETREEVGIPGDRIEIVGELPPIWTPSRVMITPFVGLARDPIERIDLVISPAEIASVFWSRLEDFRGDGVYRSEPHVVSGVSVEVDSFYLGPHRIWGATGSMLKNFLERLDRLHC